MKSTLFALAFGTSAITLTALLPAAAQAQQKIEVVANLTGAMPTGVTVAPNGRIFVNYPQWGDNSPFTVAELKGGNPIAYPDAAMNRADAEDAANHLISVQSVVADGANRLWVLDTGAPGFTA